MQLERNEKGEVRDEDGLVCTVPQGMSMLAVLGNKVNVPTERGSVYAEDYWIYVDGKKTRKWFKPVFAQGHTREVNVWPPILKDIPKLEERTFAMHQKYMQFFNAVYTPAFDAVVKVKRAHAHVTHKYEGDNPPFWLYRASDCCGQMGIGFDWLDEKPKKLLNIEIGDAWYQAEHHQQRLGGRWHCFTTVLSKAIMDYVYQNYPPKQPDTTLRLEINGREYWYRTSYSNGGAVVWNELVWPEDKVITAKVSGPIV